MKLLYSVLLLLSLIFPAQARSHHHVPRFHTHSHSIVSFHHVNMAHSHHHVFKRRHGLHPVTGQSEGRPSAWCGWQMRQWFGGGPEYNLAANWRHRGSPSNAQVGAYVVWPHHVGVITGYDSSRSLWVVKSGNDGHQVRERPRSLAGASIRLEIPVVGNFKKAVDTHTGG